MLDRLNRSQTKEILRGTSGEEVYLGGGSGSILFDKKGDAVNLPKKPRALYQQETANARVSVEAAERREGESFPDWMARGVWSRKGTSWHGWRRRRVAGWWICPCTSCGVASAEQIPCRMCRAIMNFTFGAGKRNRIGHLYQDVKRNRDARIPLNNGIRGNHKACGHASFSPLLWRQWRSGSKEKRQTLVPKDFNLIADHSRPRNYVGFIYADGNRMGEIITSMGTQFPDDKDAKQA